MWPGVRKSRLASVVIGGGEEERVVGAVENDTLATKGGLDPKLHPIRRRFFLLPLLSLFLRPTPILVSSRATDRPPLNYRLSRNRVSAIISPGHSWVSPRSLGRWVGGAAHARVVLPSAGGGVLLGRPGMERRERRERTPSAASFGSALSTQNGKDNEWMEAARINKPLLF